MPRHELSVLIDDILASKRRQVCALSDGDRISIGDVIHIATCTNLPAANKESDIEL